MARITEFDFNVERAIILVALMEQFMPTAVMVVAVVNAPAPFKPLDQST
jgi:hypothetical protein